ncbi:recombinase family protein [Streptomyces sp. NPDC001404]|uniref:recombinase family protein n=1 Tax=Streptomyces sp. NPDC001404 TaxID=3364571 RepID=UPI0036AD8293
MEALTRGNLYVPAMPSIGVAQLIPVIGYVRVSTWREEAISNEIQKTVIMEAAARRGRYVAKWIEDLDESGRHFKRDIMRGIELVEAQDNPLNEIWVWKFSRFGRSRYGVAINLARIEHVGGQLVSATEDVDASTAVGEFTRDMLFAVAAFESNRAGEQWKETHELRRSMGLPATGGKRFGYRWHPRRVPDGEGGWLLQNEWYQVLSAPAEVAHEGFQRYTAGKVGFGKISAWWNDLGFFNTRGAPWQDQTVKWYFDSGFAAGLLITHKRDVRCGDPARCQKRDHYDYRPAEHEAIVTGDEWDAYEDRREKRKLTPRRALEPVYPLAGLVKCGVCQRLAKPSAAMIHMSRGIPGYAYRCGARARHLVNHEPVWIRRVLVESEVLNWLTRVRDEIDAIAAGKIVLPKPRKTPGVAAKRKLLIGEIAKLTAALDRATEGNVLGRIPDDTYERTRDRLTKQRADKQKELDAAGPGEPEEPAGPHHHRETVLGLIKEWDTIDVKSKRVILASIIRRVEIGPNDSVEVVPVWAPADPPVPVRRKASHRARS